jgi:hypothetical protein
MIHPTKVQLFLTLSKSLALFQNDMEVVLSHTLLGQLHQACTIVVTFAIRNIYYAHTRVVKWFKGRGSTGCSINEKNNQCLHALMDSIQKVSAHGMG